MRMLAKKKAEQLKTENKVMGKEKNVEEYDFKDKLHYSLHLNMPIFKIFSDYFNILKQNKNLQKEQRIKVKGFLISNEFRESVNLYDSFGPRNILVEYEGMIINLVFDVYKYNNEVVYYFLMTSNKETTLEPEEVYNMLFANAVAVSDLKGKHLVLKKGMMEWEKKELEKKEFGDIFLPKSTIEDLKLYTTTFDKVGILMRYLMAGNPGTGKTESTLVTANELNKAGVTIIKTPICNLLKEKVELGILLAPTIFIFDDIDLSLGSRNRGYFSENLQLFLDVLDGTEKLPSNVGIIATTNSTSLLDLAAQRPGRFDKYLSFDELSKDNIKNIILKSLKCNDPNASAERKKVFSGSNVVDMFFNKRVTGAYIFTSVKMLNLRMNMLQLGDMSSKWIADEISKEINISDKNKNKNFLDDKLSNSGAGSIGFGGGDDTEEGYQSPEAGCVNEKTEEKISAGEGRGGRRPGLAQ